MRKERNGFANSVPIRAISVFPLSLSKSPINFFRGYIQSNVRSQFFRVQTGHHNAAVQQRITQDDASRMERGVRHRRHYSRRHEPVVVTGGIQSGAVQIVRCQLIYTAATRKRTKIKLHTTHTIDIRDQVQRSVLTTQISPRFGARRMRSRHSPSDTFPSKLSLAGRTL